MSAKLGAPTKRLWANSSDPLLTAAHRVCAPDAPKAALLAAPRQAEAFGLASQPKLHAQLFHELFRPSAAFRHRLAKRGLPSTGRLIGVHFRAGDTNRDIHNVRVQLRNKNQCEDDKPKRVVVLLGVELRQIWDRHMDAPHSRQLGRGEEGR